MIVWCSGFREIVRSTPIVAETGVNRNRRNSLCNLRQRLAPYYSDIGRPSLDPELMIRMLLIGYLYGIRSERRLVEEVHLNLAYRWFCGLDLKGDVPERSSFSKTRHGRFRDSDAFRL